jgi:hypothetical protein
MPCYIHVEIIEKSLSTGIPYMLSGRSSDFPSLLAAFPLFNKQ